MSHNAIPGQTTPINNQAQCLKMWPLYHCKTTSRDRHWAFLFQEGGDE